MHLNFPPQTDQGCRPILIVTLLWGKLDVGVSASGNSLGGGLAQRFGEGPHDLPHINRGEVLATLQSILQWAIQARRNQGQAWIDVQYVNSWTWRTLLPVGWVKAHGMHQLACFMNDPLDEAARSQGK
jgi:hypothetical protein